MAELEAQIAALKPKRRVCDICGYWDPDRRKQGGHVANCRRKAKRSGASSGAEPKPS